MNIPAGNEIYVTLSSGGEVLPPPGEGWQVATIMTLASTHHSSSGMAIDSLAFIWIRSRAYGRVEKKG
jgi:hypothetical protein